MLTAGTMIKGTSIAMDDAIGELFWPRTKNKTTPRDKPVTIPAWTPSKVVRFQYKAYKNGAMNEPATQPQDKDMSVTIKAKSYLAMKYENTMNTPLKKRIIISEFSFEITGLTWPLYKSIAIADADTSTSDDNVDIEADRTNKSMTAINIDGR